jgi:protein-S-isoprenylcysteine O-methyltransferase Ste14
MKSVLLISLATGVYAVVHSLLASLGVKDQVQRHFGPAADRGYRLFYNLFAILSGLPILLLLLLLPDQLIYQIPFPWLLLSGFGQLAGIAIIVIGILQTDPWHFIGLRQILKPDDPISSTMITGGLYRWVRHPLYTGGLLLIWCMPRMTQNLLTIFILLTIYLIVGARLEEKRLVREFGDQYRVYQQQVPILLPIKWPRKQHGK